MPKKKKRHNKPGNYGSEFSEMAKEEEKNTPKKMRRPKWQRGESRRLQRCDNICHFDNKYVLLVEGSPSKQIFAGKSVTSNRSEEDVALAVAKKAWRRNKAGAGLIEIMHIATKQKYRFDPMAWTTENGKMKFSNTAKSKRKGRWSKASHFEGGNDFYGGSPASYDDAASLRINVPAGGGGPSSSSRVKQARPRDFDLDPSSRARKSPRPNDSTGLTPRLQTFSLESKSVLCAG